MTRRTRRGAGAVALAAALLISACGNGDDNDPAGPDAPPTTTTPTPVPSTDPPTQAPPDGPGELPTDPGTGGEELSTESPEVAEAVADLAEHLGIDPGAVSVLGYTAVTWPDGSIGCPEPGMSYTQALVPGARLLLEAESSEYAYHAGREPDLVRCDNPQQPVPSAVN